MTFLGRKMRKANQQWSQWQTQSYFSKLWSVKKEVWIAGPIVNKNNVYANNKVLKFLLAIGKYTVLAFTIYENVMDLDVYVKKFDFEEQEWSDHSFLSYDHFTDDVFYYSDFTCSCVTMKDLKKYAKKYKFLRA